MECPKCNKEFCTLRYDILAKENGTYEQLPDGSYTLLLEDSSTDMGAIPRFYCPECGETIAEGDNEALLFIKHNGRRLVKNICIENLKILAKELKEQADSLCKEHGIIVNHENYIQALDSIEENIRGVANDILFIIENDEPVNM